MVSRSRHRHRLEASQGASSEGQLPPFRLTEEVKERTLGKLVVNVHAFYTLDLTKVIFWLNFESPQEERMMRSRFLLMRQSKVSMRDYVQMARHLASFIITYLMEMYAQLNVFVHGMREGRLTFPLNMRSLPHLRRHFE